MPSKISRSKQAKWRRKWQSTSVLLPGKFHGWRSLVGYSSCGRNESDTTEQLHFLSFYSSFWRRKWQPIPVFLPEECHGRRGLMGYSLWSCKESETTKQLTHIHTHKQAKRIKHRAHFQEDNFNREVQLSVKKKKHPEIGAIWWFIRDMQIRSSTRYPVTSIKMVIIIKKSTDNNSYNRVKKRGPSDANSH